MARVLLLTLGFLLITAVLAEEESTETEETATTLEDEATTVTQEADGLNQTESTTDQPTDSSTVTAATELIDLMTYTPEGEENGGYPFVSPGGSKHHLKQVRAHDGFHNIKREPLWAHWNDAFSTTVGHSAEQHQ